MMPNDHLLGEILLKEYEQLKEEQTHRIGIRDNLIYATFLSLAAIIAAAVPAGYTAALLLIPPVCFVLGSVYVANDDRVSAIGRYLHVEVGPRLEALAGHPVLRWEYAHRNDARRLSRKRLQLIADLTVFVLPSWTGLTMYWAFGRPNMFSLAVTGVELLSTLVLSYEIFRYADLVRGSDVRSSEMGGAR